MEKTKSKSRLLASGAGMLLGALALTACDTVSDATESLNPFTESISYSCPEALVLADAATITRYRAGSPKDVLDLEFRASMDFTKYKCEWDLDSETRAGTLSIELIPEVEATRGPAFSNEIFSVPYFITLTDENRNVLAKSQFDLQARLPSDAQRMQIRDRKVLISTPVTPDLTDFNFVVFIGFQVTPDELDYNRAERARQWR